MVIPSFIYLPVFGMSLLLSVVVWGTTVKLLPCLRFRGCVWGYVSEFITDDHWSGFSFFRSKKWIRQRDFVNFAAFFGRAKLTEILRKYINIDLDNKSGINGPNLEKQLGFYRMCVVADREKPSTDAGILIYACLYKHVFWCNSKMTVFIHKSRFTPDLRATHVNYLMV